jgi:hypothetical protein
LLFKYIDEDGTPMILAGKSVVCDEVEAEVDRGTSVLGGKGGADPVAFIELVGIGMFRGGKGGGASDAGRANRGFRGNIGVEIFGGLHLGDTITFATGDRGGRAGGESEPLDAADGSGLSISAWNRRDV